jgi:hypothetical protein
VLDGLSVDEKAIEHRELRLHFSVLASGVYSKHVLHEKDACAYADGIRKCSSPFRLRHIKQKAATARFLMENGIIREFQ